MTTTILTNAPSAYDYGYTDEVETGLTFMQYEGQLRPPTDVRRVTVPAEHATYQAGRYQSGMYFTIVVPSINDLGQMALDMYKCDPKYWDRMYPVDMVTTIHAIIASEATKETA